MVSDTATSIFIWLASLTCVLVSGHLLFLLYVGRRARLPSEVRVEQVRDVTVIPSEIRKYFHMVDESLPEFCSVGTFTRDLGPCMTEYVRFFDHPIRGDLVTAHILQITTRFNVRQEYGLQFAAAFADNTAILTTNVMHRPSFCSETSIHRTIIPEMADPSILWQVHVVVAARHPRAFDRKTPWRPDLVDWWRTELADDRQRHLREGYLAVDPRSGALGLTWKGTLRWMLAGFFPVVRVRRLWHRWRGNRLLRSLGLPRDYIRTAPLTLARPQTTPGPSSRTLFCPKCDYNLTDLTTSCCPECGEAFDAAQLAEAAAQRPQPISPLQTIGEICGLLGCLVPLAVVGAACVFIASTAGDMERTLRLIGIFVVVVISGYILKESDAACYRLALRLAVTRAQSQGSDRSGLRDTTFINLVWGGLLLFHGLAVLGVVGVLTFLLL